MNLKYFEGENSIYTYGAMKLHSKEITVIFLFKGATGKEILKITSDEMQSKPCTLLNEPINLNTYLEENINSFISEYLNNKYDFTLHEGTYQETINYSKSILNEELLLEGKPITEIRATVNFHFEYKISLKEGLDSTFVRYENRLIGFFDVLGLTEILKTAPLEAIYAEYCKYIDYSNSFVFNNSKNGVTNLNSKGNFEEAQFLFDSIVCVSKPINETHNIQNFISGCVKLLELGFKQKLPLRGAISYGNFIKDKSRNLFLSSEFAELVKAEQGQDWAGCAILEPAQQIVTDAIYGANQFAQKTAFDRSSIIIPYGVPFKEGRQTIMPCLNYYYFLSRNEVHKGLKYLSANKNKFYYTSLFFEYLNSLQDPQQLLFEQQGIKVYLKAMKMASGMRLILVDSEGNEIKHTNDITTTIAIVSNDGEKSLSQRITFKANTY